MKKYILLFFVLSAGFVHAQKYTIKGKIVDATSLDPIPFAAISFQNSSIGKNSDFDGTFSFNIEKLPSDSLLFSCIGFARKTIFVSKDSLNQQIKVFLTPTEISLQEVKIYAGENPAYAIIRKAVALKSEHNYRNTAGYDYESYNKIEIDINNLNKKIQERNITKKISKAIESVGKLTDEQGKVLLPTFISESISHYYFRNNPKLAKEIIEKTNVKGVGVTDGSLASQFIGSTFQQYNFFENQVNVLNKNFTSPIANDWKLIYEYFLDDSTFFENRLSYKIDFSPKRKQDLAFTGTIWIDKATWAISQIDATITKDANLNFVERIKIQQELSPHGKGWFPVKNRILIDVSEISNASAGMLLKFTNYNEKINTENEKLSKFFDKSIEIKPDYNEKDPAFWLKTRPESFSEQEQMAYAMIDSIKNIPTIKRLSSIGLIASTGYKPIFKGVELGNLVSIVALNNLEGLRLRPGFRTNYSFSKKWVLTGFVGYGFKDQQWKYGGEIKSILSRSPWTTLTVKCTRDIEQVGLRAEDISVNPIYSAFLKFGTLMRPYYEDERKIQFQREVSKGITAKLGIRTRTFDPLYDFTFREIPSMGETSPILKQYNTSEVLAGVKFQRDELAIESDNDRISFGAIKAPTITFAYTLGLKNVMQSNFNYHKFLLKYSHSLNLGFLGNTIYKVEAGATLGTVPYPLLKSHLGNESIFLVASSYNLMNSFEFVSDKYLAMRYFHDFEGLFFNKIPLVKKWKWRTFTTGKFLIGNLSQHEIQMNPTLNETGIRSFQSLNNKPYIEMGYGISNIFKVFRVEAIHRLTHLDNVGARKFGVKFSAEITL